MKLTNTTSVARPANVSNQLGHPKQSLADMGIEPGGPHFTQDGLSLSCRPGGIKPGFPGGQKPSFPGGEIRPGGPFPIGQKPGFPGAGRPGIPAGMGEPKLQGHGIIDFNADMKPTDGVQISRPAAAADAGRQPAKNPIGDGRNWQEWVLR
jgi:hypothetical protein